MTFEDSSPDDYEKALKGAKEMIVLGKP